MGADGGIVVDLLRLRVYAQLFGLVETEKALRVAIRRAAKESGLETGLSDLEIARAVRTSKDLQNAIRQGLSPERNFPAICHIRAANTANSA